MNELHHFFSSKLEVCSHSNRFVLINCNHFCWYTWIVRHNKQLLLLLSMFFFRIKQKMKGKKRMCFAKLFSTNSEWFEWNVLLFLDFEKLNWIEILMNSMPTFNISFKRFTFKPSCNHNKGSSAVHRTMPCGGVLILQKY